MIQADKKEFYVMLTAKNGKVAGTFISSLYDLQTGPKENASGPSRAYPGHRLHIDSIDDKKTVVKANKNAPTNIPWQARAKFPSGNLCRANPNITSPIIFCLPRLPTF